MDFKIRPSDKTELRSKSYIYTSLSGLIFALSVGCASGSKAPDVLDVELARLESQTIRESAQEIKVLQREILELHELIQLLSNRITVQGHLHMLNSVPRPASYIPTSLSEPQEVSDETAGE